MATKTKTREINRSAKTGEFVTEAYAKKHKSTTETERVPVKSPSKKKGK